MNERHIITIFGLLVVLALLPFDAAIAQFLSQDAACKPIFEAITEAGRSHWYLVPGGVVMLYGLVKKWRGAIWQFCTLLFFAVGSSGIFVNIIKPIFARARPRELFADGTQGFFHWPEVLAGNLSDYNSFPSGHAATAMAAGMAIVLCLPTRLQWLHIPILTTAVVIAWSRVMITVHYASDVVAGAIIGVWAAVLCQRYLARAAWAAAISKP